MAIASITAIIIATIISWAAGQEATALPDWAQSAYSTGYYGPSGWVAPQAVAGGGSGSGGTGGGSQAAIVGASVGGGLVALFALIAGFVVYRRRAQPQPERGGSALAREYRRARGLSDSEQAIPLQPTKSRVSAVETRDIIGESGRGEVAKEEDTNGSTPEQ